MTINSVNATTHNDENIFQSLNLDQIEADLLAIQKSKIKKKDVFDTLVQQHFSDKNFLTNLQNHLIDTNLDNSYTLISSLLESIKEKSINSLGPSKITSQRESSQDTLAIQLPSPRFTDKIARVMDHLHKHLKTNDKFFIFLIMFLCISFIIFVIFL